VMPCETRHSPSGTDLPLSAVRLMQPRVTRPRQPRHSLGCIASTILTSCSAVAASTRWLKSCFSAVSQPSSPWTEKRRIHSSPSRGLELVHVCLEVRSRATSGLRNVTAADLLRRVLRGDLLGDGPRHQRDRAATEAWLDARLQVACEFFLVVGEHLLVAVLALLVLDRALIGHALSSIRVSCHATGTRRESAKQPG
jgi:hypothetical protein